MRKRVRRCALFMSAAMLFSSFWGAWGMAAYAEENPPSVEAGTSPGTDGRSEVKQPAAADGLAPATAEQQDTAGLDKTAPGGVKPVSANVALKVPVKTDTATIAEDADGALVVIPDRSQVFGEDVSFDSSSTWDDQGGKTYEIGMTTDHALKSGAYVTLDILLPENASYNGIIKVQGVVKVGSEWTWTEASNIPELSLADFGDVSDGYKKASIQFDFGEDVEAGEVKVFILKLAGYQCDYSGSVYVENIRLYDAAGEQQPSDEPLQKIAARSQVYGQDITFDSSSDWSEVSDAQGSSEYNIPLVTTAPLKSGAYITMDILVPADKVSYSGIMKVQGIARLGSKWDWKEIGIVDMDAAMFTDTVDSYKKASIRFDFTEGALTDVLAQFTMKLAGYQCDYSGPVYVENIKLFDGTGDQKPLPPTDDSIIDDFESYALGADGDWKEEAGWQYDNGMQIAVEEFDGSQALGVELDYTGYGDVSWSEAKVKKEFAAPYDVSKFNCLVMDFYFPDAFQSGKIKVFADGLLNADVAVGAGESLGNGYRKTQLTFKFSPSDTPLENLTIGLVGVNTEFRGKLYLDNIKLTQESAEGDFVEITSVPGAGTQANTSGAPATVTLADKDATDSARALYAYLIAVKNNHQVLFGHENDINKAVNSSAAEGDVKDVTGSLSAIYGLDSLSLTGAELGITDAAQAVATSADNSIAAARQGAIVSLSAHMPNFTNSKITQRADGSYDFTTCDFNESKDLSNNCAEQILPGGDYNAQFNAYLDIIADYAKRLQSEGIPILFRPFHENNGSWFWWGSGTSVESYKSMFRYAEEYLQASGVHNMIYVYSPNGPFSSESKYMERYPGDEYIDVLAFDYYDDYNTYPATSDGSFFAGLNNTCSIVSSLAAARGKIAAISETGVRVMKENGSDNEGLLVSGNPVAMDKTGTNWYQKVADIADDNDMPYYLVWANFGDTNFYVPYKYSDTLGHEMINEFIDFYNDGKSVFANGTNFYGQIGGVAMAPHTNPYGYLIAPFERSVILGATALRGSVANAGTVEFKVVNTDTNESVTIAAARKDGSILNEYEAILDDTKLAALGQTDSAVITLLGDGVEIACIRNISLGKDKDKAPASIIENFDYYAGSDGLLDVAYVENSAAGCSSEFLLDSTHKSDGSYGGRFHYVLETTGNEVWTGRVKTLENNDYSAYNALTMWVQPDGMGQKVVLQLADGSGEEFEVYLTEFNKGTEAKYVTVPFSAFKGKKGGTLDPSQILKFAVWCNSIVPDGHTGTWKVDSSIYFDGIQCIKASDELLGMVNGDGLIITDESQAPRDPSDDDGNDGNHGSDGDHGTSDDDGNDGGQDSGQESGASATGWNGLASWSTELNYMTFNVVGEQKIKAAKKDATIVITTLNWVSFHKSVFQALQARPDVTLTINYRFEGKYYTVTIPAGADVSGLANKDGFCGFRYLDQVFQGHEIVRFKETGIKYVETVPKTDNKKN